MIASIHQPSSSTFDLFDKLLLLGKGKSCYFGPTDKVGAHFEKIGYPLPLHMNPAEYILDIVSTDFSRDDDIVSHDEKHGLNQPNRTANARLEYAQQQWKEEEIANPNCYSQSTRIPEKGQKR